MDKMSIISKIEERKQEIILGSVIGIAGFGYLKLATWLVNNLEKLRITSERFSNSTRNWISILPRKKVPKS